MLFAIGCSYIFMGRLYEPAFKKPLHLRLSPEDVGKYVFLPGSVERVEKIASLLDDARVVGRHREFYAMTGAICGTPVSVISTGIGGPSTSIVMEELASMGVHTMVRIGSCASSSPDTKIGDVMIPRAAVKMEGTSRQYLPDEFPAVPDWSIFKCFVRAAEKLGFPFNTGVTITKDSFYTEASMEEKPVYPMLEYLWDAYEKGGASNTSMECSTIFTIGAVLGIRTASVMISATNYKAYSNDVKDYPSGWEQRAIEVGVEGMRLVIEEDRKGGKA